MLAVFAAVKEARKRSLEQGRAVLVESMTYRYKIILAAGHAVHILAELAIIPPLMIPSPIAHDRKSKIASALITPCPDYVFSLSLEAGGMLRKKKHLS